MGGWAGMCPGFGRSFAAILAADVVREALVSSRTCLQVIFMPSRKTNLELCGG